MMTKVIHLDDHRKPEPCVVHRDSEMTVFGRTFTVRRTAWSGNPAGGWFTVRDDNGEMLFVRAGEMADVMVRELVMAWVDGFGVGRRQAAKAAARGTGDIA